MSPPRQVPGSLEQLHYSLLSPVGYRTSSCGYCKGPESSQNPLNRRASYYVSTQCLTVEDYQVLVDRGWRRSGTLLYKPDNRLSCCAQHAIRIPVADLRVRRDQRQALNRWTRHVLGEDHIQAVKKTHPLSKHDKRADRNTFNLINAVHACEYSRLRTLARPEHEFEVDLEEDNFTTEKFELFMNYQQHVHKEEQGESTATSFKRFLCNSPLVRKSTRDPVADKTKLLGSYHQTYRLDGRLVAMGVIDLLPHCVSGVYFMYHSDFDRWSFGKLSALREATLALENGYDFYYMGFYIHTCQKMRYKADYQPQYFLDLECHGWDPLDDNAKSLMLSQKHVSMSRERSKTKPETLSQPDSTHADESKSSDKGGPETTQDDLMRLNATCSIPLLTASHNPTGDISPADVVNQQLSCLQIDMPGVMTLAEVQDQCNLDATRIRFGRGSKKSTAQAQDFTVWDQGAIGDLSTLKGMVAELAGCIGPELIKRIIVNLSSD